MIEEIENFIQQRKTVGCRRQLGGIVRLILYDFVKIPQSFFCSKKTTGQKVKQVQHIQLRKPRREFSSQGIFLDGG